MKKINQLGITSKAYFIVGLGIIKSAKSARWMNNNLFGISIPENIINRIEKSDNEKKEGTKICIELIEKYKNANLINITNNWPTAIAAYEFNSFIIIIHDLQDNIKLYYYHYLFQNFQHKLDFML